MPDFDRSIIIDFQGAKLSSDTGFIVMRELDHRHNAITPISDVLQDVRSISHTKHSPIQMIRQRIYQMTGGYEDCNDADFLRIDPALRLALGKGNKFGAGRSALSRLENDILGNPEGLKALDAAVLRAADALIKKNDKHRFILNVDSTEDPAYGKQEGFVYNCEKEHVTYFIRLPMNETLRKIMEPELTTRPVGRPPKSGVKAQRFGFYYRAGSWKRRRQVVCKVEWHTGELFPRVGFIVTNSTLRAREVVKVYNGRAKVENRIKEAKNTLRWDKTICHRFKANQARLKMGALAYNLLHMVREFHLQGEEVKRSMKWLIRRIIKAAYRISSHGHRWWVHMASSFPLAHHYRAVLGTG